MRFNYQRNLYEDTTPDLTYKECLNIIRGLETVKKHHLRNSPVVENMATLMHQRKVRDLAWLSQLIEDTANKVLVESKLPSTDVEHSKPSY